MKFESWIAERNQRDAMKSPRRKTSLELHIAASKKSANDMVCGKAGPMQSDGKHRRKNRGGENREDIRRSEGGE